MASAEHSDYRLDVFVIKIVSPKPAKVVCFVPQVGQFCFCSSAAPLLRCLVSFRFFIRFPRASCFQPAATRIAFRI